MVEAAARKSSEWTQQRHQVHARFEETRGLATTELLSLFPSWWLFCFSCFLSDCIVLMQHWQRHAEALTERAVPALVAYAKAIVASGEYWLHLEAVRSMTYVLSLLLLTNEIMCMASVGYNIFQCCLFVSLMNFSCLGVLLRRVVPDRHTISQGA